MTILERHATEENTLQIKSEPPTYFPPAPKVNRWFTFLYFFLKKPFITKTDENTQIFLSLQWTVSV